MNDPKPARVLTAEEPGSAYAGRTRYTQLEYEALLANLSLGIAFTRERRVFLCNPKFAEKFGYGPDEMIGMPGDRKSTRLNSSHSQISYAVFCLKKKKTHKNT